MKNENYYVRESGEKVIVKDMNTTFIINALNKIYNNIWNSTSNVQYNTYLRNINVLSQELEKRFIQFEIEKFGGNN